MFDNIGEKLMGLAKVICWIGIILSIIIAIVIWVDNSNYHDSSLTFLGILVLVGGSFGSWICSWALYAFGQLVSDTESIEYHIKEISKNCSSLRSSSASSTEALNNFVSKTYTNNSGNKPEKAQSDKNENSSSVDETNSIITCPVCHSKQRAGRSVCYLCGAVLKQD